MRALESRINTRSAPFAANQAAMGELISELQVSLEKSRFQGKEKYIARARERGKLLARERIELVLDQDAPFLELMPLAGMQRKDINVGGTLVCGIGIVAGRWCMITANVGTIKGGAIDFTTLQKGFRANEIALENRLPVINLVESAGANLPEQAQIFSRGGLNFRDITERSKAGIPTISVVFGNSTAGGAYIPGMSDYSIFVRDKAKVFLAGPPLVKMATNEVTDEESLGGALMHSSVSGVSDYLAESEEDGIRLAREIIESMRHESAFVPEDIAAPLYDSEELNGIIPSDLSQPFDMREVIARVVDGSEFHEFKPMYGSTLVTGFAKVHGYEVGVIGNNGILFSEAANKGAQFIQLCNQQNRPLLFMQNITGFMVGRKYEEEGIIKHGAKMINAVSNSNVPAITIMVGASYGAGNYAMCGRSYKPRFLYTLPNHKIAVMGAEQLGGVMEIVARSAAKKSGYDYNEEQGAAMKQMFMQQVDQESSVWYSTSNLWDDGIIQPNQMRDVLGLSLAVIYDTAFESDGKFGVFRM